MERFLAGRPNAAMREASRQLLSLDIDSEAFSKAVKAYDRVMEQMARHLDSAPWLAGSEYSLADIALLPYVVRLEHLALSRLWDGQRGSVGQWLEGCKARANFGGIANYIDQKYLELMGPQGRAARPQIEAILAT
jgi:glutathione S-transferase